MRVLYISNFKNQSGWSKQAQNHMLALDLAGVNVVPVHINILNNQDENIPERLLELEKASPKNPDIIIFNTLPNFMEKTSRAKCVGYSVFETSDFDSTGWAHYLNLMDNVFVPNYYNKQVCISSGVTAKLDIVPECIDIEKCQQDWPEHQIRKNLSDRFIFLCVAEWTQRKNIDAIIKVFHIEFSPSENVELVIKTTPVGMKNPQQEINERLDRIKQNLKLYKDLRSYKREHVLCGFIPETEMYSLLASSDSYVTASRAEGFNISCAQALAMGKIIVGPNHSGMDYLTEKNAWIVRSYEQPCYNALDTLPDLYTARESWQDVNIYSLCEAMRSAYEKKIASLNKQQQAKKDALQFSFESVGQIYKKTLENLLNGK